MKKSISSINDGDPTNLLRFVRRKQMVSEDTCKYVNILQQMFRVVTEIEVEGKTLPMNEGIWRDVEVVDDET